MHRIEDFINDDNKLFCIDVDDILLATTVDWIKLINNDIECIEILKMNNEYPVRIENWRHWDYITDILGNKAFKFHEDNTIYSETTLIKYSIEFINLIIKKIGINRLRFVTASHDNNKRIKEEILFKFFNISKSNIYHISNKEDFYRGNIVLDDAVHNHLSVIDDINTLCIMLNQPWNKYFKHNNLNRVNSLSELIFLLK